MVDEGDRALRRHPGRTRRPLTRRPPVNGRVAPPVRVKNNDRRTREHLTPPEVEKLMAAAGRLGRHGHRDATLTLCSPSAIGCASASWWRCGPLTDSAVRKIVAGAVGAAKLGVPVHPHMVRHASSYKLANDGHDTRAIQHYVGHRNIQHTVRYTELAPDRFKGFSKD